MIWYIAVKDIRAFFLTEKKVFVWLLICMVCGAFVLNYSYSFARNYGSMYEQASGAAARYKIIGNAPASACDGILKQISEEGLPGIKDHQLFKNREDGLTVAGSSFISRNSSWFTGDWVEGYAAEIENTGENLCAVENGLLDYGDRYKMTGEAFDLDGEEFTIRGVFGSWGNNTGVVIFADKFAEKYGEFDSLWITLERHLNEPERAEFEKIIKANLPNAAIMYPPEPGTVGESHAKAQRLQYTAIIVMLVVCLVLLIKYWQAVNISAYTIYWINGAANGCVMLAALCESLLLCVSTYLIGLGLNAAFRSVSKFSASITINDVLTGFGIFFGTFAVFTLINTAKICKQFNVTNVRRD